MAMAEGVPGLWMSAMRTRGRHSQAVRAMARWASTLAGRRAATRTMSSSVRRGFSSNWPITSGADRAGVCRSGAARLAREGLALTEGELAAGAVVGGAQHHFVVPELGRTAQQAAEAREAKLRRLLTEVVERGVVGEAGQGHHYRQHGLARRALGPGAGGAQ